mgnify:CR=1 FL=1
MTNELKFTEDHEWVKVEGDIAVIGISEHATEELGEIVYVDILAQGEDVDRTGEFGSVESVKTVSSLYSPVSGTVVERNASVIDKPEEINNSPYENGWLVKLKLTDSSELDDLMNESQYKEYLESQ